MIKAIAKLCLQIFVFLVSIVYSYKTSVNISNLKNKIFTFWIKQLFKKCGKNVSFRKPLYLIGPQYISIGENFGALDRFRIECWDQYKNEKFNPSITIGDNVAVGYNVHIGCINEITIGNNVLFASNIFIEDCNHGYADSRDFDIAPLDRSLYSKGPVIIKDNVWVGENVAIMPNVTIGKNAIIGANSVVTKDVPDYSVVVGNPAKVIKNLKK